MKYVINIEVVVLRLIKIIQYAGPVHLLNIVKEERTGRM
jgi:hypothetical protein